MYKRSFVVLNKNNIPVGLLWKLTFGCWAMEKSLEPCTASMDYTGVNKTELYHPHLFWFFALGNCSNAQLCRRESGYLLQTKRYLWSFRASEDTCENEQISRGSVIGHRESVISSEMLVWS